jgi:hypothetical protein
MKRLNRHHLKQLVGNTISDNAEKGKVLALIEQYIQTAQQDQQSLVAGIQGLVDKNVKCQFDPSGHCIVHPELSSARQCPHVNAKNLLERFGPMPAMVLSTITKGKNHVSSL